MLGKNTILYRGYKATDPKHNLVQLISDHTDEKDNDAHLVIQLDEVDQCLTWIMDPKGAKKRDVIMDAKDKADWNTLLETVHDCPNVILLMTTNCTLDQLHQICGHDASMLRNGRVTGMLHVPYLEGEEDGDLSAAAAGAVRLTLSQPPGKDVSLSDAASTTSGTPSSALGIRTPSRQGTAPSTPRHRAQSLTISHQSPTSAKRGTITGAPRAWR